MGTKSINLSLTSTPPPSGDACDPHSHLAYPNTSQSSYMFDDTTYLNEEEYQAHIHSLSIHADPLTAHDTELYPTTHGQLSFPLTSFLPTPNIDMPGSARIQRRYSIQASVDSLRFNQQYARPGSIVFPQVLDHQGTQEFCVNPADIFGSSAIAAGCDRLNPSSLMGRGTQSIVSEVKSLVDKLYPTEHYTSQFGRPSLYQHGRDIYASQHSELDVTKPGIRNKLDTEAPPLKSSPARAGGPSLTQQDTRKRPLKTPYAESPESPTPRYGEVRHPCEWVGCTESFSRRHDLNRHRKSCHLQSKEECSRCGKSLSRADSVKRHLDNCKA